MRLRVGAILERIRSSFFAVPLAAVVGAVILGQLGIAIDTRLEGVAGDLPFATPSTVDSARAVLTTVAGATIGFAGIAFSVSLLVIQLGSSQFSPRVVHTLFRDPFNKRIIGLVVATFAYCLIVLRAVRSAGEDGGDEMIPNLSTSFAVVLGVVAILAIVAFINHSAHSMDISEILARVSRNSIETIRSEWQQDEPDPDASRLSVPLTGPTHEVRFNRSGWVQQIDRKALLECVPENGAIVLDSHPGRYAIAGTLLCTVSPRPDDVEESEHGILAAIDIGDTRTMQQDVSYGLRQLVDVALKALSPGVNDPTTAQDAIFHASEVLLELLRRFPPPAELTTEGGRRLLTAPHSHDEMIRLAFEETRRAAADHPAVCIYLLTAIASLHEALTAARLPRSLPALVEQADLVVAGCEQADPLPTDLHRVRAAHEDHFGPR